MAISIGTAAFLRVLCEQVMPASILDLGSGFNSFVLRSFAATCTTAVWTVDDNPAWQERTRAFLKAGGLDDSNMWLWPDFSKETKRTFDLVCYDLGSMVARAQALRSVLEWVGEKTILVLDDMHKEEFALEVERALRSSRWRYFDARTCTMDQYGRFCGVVLSAAHPLLR
jgi:predicted O-methyltransferase YrrM